MYPVLLRIGGIELYSYGLFVALGFLAGIGLAKHQAARAGIDPAKVGDLCFYILLAAILGSRLFYVATNLRAFAADPLEIFRIWNGGLVFYGGFIGALVTAAVYMKQSGLPPWPTLDVMAPSLALGHAIGRIGCFFAGCCHGKICEYPWAVVFHHEKSLAPTGIPLHPTQLYSALNNFLIFASLLFLRRFQKYDGQLFWIYVMIYGLTRSVIEIFRGDFRGGTVLGVLSVSQAIGLSLVLVAVWMLRMLKDKPSRLLRNHV